MLIENTPVIRELQALLNQNITRDNYSALEAGCGSASHVSLPAEMWLVGLDISAKQLDRNNRLNEKIIGDIQNFDFKNRVFDLVICWDVLEHVSKPLFAIRNLINATKPGGILVLAMPNINSLWGLVTKFTPHRLHILFYRYFLGNKEAGKNDNSPFPTFLRWAISPNSVSSFILANSGNIEFFKSYDPMLPVLQKRHRLLFFSYVFFSNFLRFLSFGKLGGLSNSGLVFLIRKK